MYDTYTNDKFVIIFASVIKMTNLPFSRTQDILNTADSEINAPLPPECPPVESLPIPAHDLFKPMSAGAAQIHTAKVDLDQHVNFFGGKK